uniref:NADH-ubiquinone oxidoreductase chain 2 n=1 Tax=Protaeolidiella atra TaxID=1154746 RepID=A0A7S7AAK3_9GAST|nr:NADH dehydrogenase subunit 2 [Protaeolidiella atra]QOW38679.1 NADH dehydrogenase subunit 2 [Protaeolidiella atra]
MSTGNFLFLSLMGLGPMMAVSSSNWLMCWVGVELSFLGLVPILLSDGYSIKSLSGESSLKYFCIQAVGSGLLMCGGIMYFLIPSISTLISSSIFLASIILKLGIFPFHFWVPSVVSGLNWNSMFLILTWQKLAPFLFLMNILESNPSMSAMVFMLGGFSAVVGAFIGLNQTKIGPVLGASSITHGGWISIGAACGNFWTYFFTYCFSLLMLVLFLNEGFEFLCGMTLLSLSGLPPFIMFIGKWSILKSALTLSENWWFLILPLLGSIFSLFFYLKFFYSFYLESESSFILKLGTVSCFSLGGLLGAFLIMGF